MKPVRRRVRRHFGATAKRVAVRSHRPWYFQAALGAGFVLLGFGIAYLMLHDDEIAQIRTNLQQVTLENRSLQTKLVEAQRALQVEQATNNQLAKELASVQDDNIKTKGELVFYKNMLQGKKPR